ncbi:MAG: sugar nucleotide-binding protein [Chitinivibrionales bacterium]|nr:sugar nucleotide-binding protein [Chitinivibrionales bacterium]MBD3394790.1 sugar nucleotide-binding protein [Chitinivibrionales bacterium]
MKRLLVTGASGFLGHTLCSVARKSWDVHGAAHAHDVCLEGVHTVKLDITDHRSVREALRTIRPDALIHLAALSKPDYCQAHPAESRAVNVNASSALAGTCAETGAACVFASSDLVFDGARGMYTETDPVGPVSVYGEHKVEAEQRMREENPAVTVCRLPLMFGLRSPSSASFIQPMIARLEKAEPQMLFDDEFRSPASASSVAAGLLLAIDCPGEMLHLGGRERLSRFRFGRLLAEVTGCACETIQRCSQNDIDLPAPRPCDVSLDSAKAFALGHNPLCVRDELIRLLAGVPPQ